MRITGLTVYTHLEVNFPLKVIFITGWTTLSLAGILLEERPVERLEGT
jgi:hypothetical protein